MRTRSLLAVVLLKPRALMAHWRESTCATCKLEASRSTSGRLDAPDRRMSSCVITWIAEAVCDRRSGRFETEVTCRFISCSILSFFKASADGLESGCWANPDPGKQTRTNVRSIAVGAATILVSAIGRYPLVDRGRGRRELSPNNMPFWYRAVVTHVTHPTANPNMAVPER